MAIITVVIPVYNGEKYVRRAVESVVMQPEKDTVQVLLIDDGSKDSSGRICDSLAEVYQNVRVIHKENGGVSSARNLGIQNVTTKYVAFLDCDDWWEPDFLDVTMVEEFSAPNSADVWQFAYREISHSGSLARNYPLVNADIVFDGPGVNRYDWRYHCSFVFSVEHLKRNEVMYPDSKIGEDGPFVEMALFQARKLSKREKYIFNYWENFQSCIHTRDWITDVLEGEKALLAVATYLKKYGIERDTDADTAWSLLTAMPRICAENDYATAKAFIDKKGMEILDRRPDIHFREDLRNRLEMWKSNPKKYWIKCKISIGIPLKVRAFCYKIPLITTGVNYLFNRYRRKMVPYKKREQQTG